MLWVLMRWLIVGLWPMLERLAFWLKLTLDTVHVDSGHCKHFLAERFEFRAPRTFGRAISQAGGIGDGFCGFPERQADLARPIDCRGTTAGRGT